MRRSGGLPKNQHQGHKDSKQREAAFINFVSLWRALLFRTSVTRACAFGHLVVVEYL